MPYTLSWAKLRGAQVLCPDPPAPRHVHAIMLGKSHNGIDTK